MSRKKRCVACGGGCESQISFLNKDDYEFDVLMCAKCYRFFNPIQSTIHLAKKQGKNEISKSFSKIEPQTTICMLKCQTMDDDDEDEILLKFELECASADDWEDFNKLCKDLGFSSKEHSEVFNKFFNKPVGSRQNTVLTAPEQTQTQTQTHSLCLCRTLCQCLCLN